MNEDVEVWSTLIALIIISIIAVLPLILCDMFGLLIGLGIVVGLPVLILIIYFIIHMISKVKNENNIEESTNKNYFSDPCNSIKFNNDLIGLK